MRALLLPPEAKAVLAGVVLAALFAGLAAAGLSAANAATAARQAQKQQKEKDKEKEKEKTEESKSGGLFTGFRKVSGMQRGEEKRATASAGAKGVGEGKEIGNAAASATDRSRVATMESSKPNKEEMAAFLQEGRLSTARKGGGQ